MTAVTAPSVARAQTLITLADGQVQGHLNGGTREFLGIPYAAPPVGALRWRPPAPVVPWSGVLDADAYPPACPQLPSSSPIAGTASEEEDCLYLNVWTPDPAPAKPLPVMVWIHGGFNTGGSTGDFGPYPPYENVRLYDGSALSARQNVVVVSMNYRLGVFGFFWQEALASEDPDYPYAGNQGLLDQRAALLWVRNNIAAFGGDPGNVTIFGQSGGAVDVCAHVVSPMSNGLFHRAISQSGGCTGFDVGPTSTAAALANFVIGGVGCDGVDPADVLACLRAKPVADLLAAGAGVQGFVTIDGGFLPAHPIALFDAGTFARVPYLLGANADEGTYFPPDVVLTLGYENTLVSLFGQEVGQLLALLYRQEDFPSLPAAFARVIGDGLVLCPTYDVARRVAAARRRTHVYQFARVPPLPSVSHLGAFHGAEIPYVFGSAPLPTDDDTLLSAHMQGYWARFAAKGRQPRQPRALKSPHWPRFRPRNKGVLFDPFPRTVGRGYDMLRLDALGERDDIVKVKDFRRAECDFWSLLYEQAS